MLIAAVETVLPPNRYEQEEITKEFARVCDVDENLLRRFHAAARVGARSLALPLDAYAGLDGFTAANDAYIETALDLATQAALRALDTAGVAAHDVCHIMMCSSTGLATPSLDARLAQRIGLRQGVKRVPVFGLGCVAGAAGLARVHDYLRAWPDEVALLVCVELCSLTLQREDTSLANLVGSSLFGDGAAAVVAYGERRAAQRLARGPVVVSTRSRLYPDSGRLMGWEVGGHGFRLVLAPDLVDVVEKHLAADVAAFLAEHAMLIGEVGTWVCHPGGPKVIEKIAEVLALPPGALDLTWRSLNEMGNVSSVSVLNVLQRTMAEREPAPGSFGLLTALGPGFSAEFVLLRW
ncbi:alpha-pyrone synthesis polyketide synthase-like Pks11 [Microtetraspora sp. NBRC 13810]|uniref:type III polyketide synthase n=1 Tax=Microtetraspora sp. NBRC 13810 TaxID=3030990 RepID=UPI0024A318FB|nr:3-oxoacyl-[acyl-carrier-protein] synthase III C-terminal domain-containing protein [Microtetraspora sp. NBRC 13810]GLW06404.1 alpha-pyrone synthesis polyketide synthase-like Pks11 [Microtetraspora sp. NBRC 13810]